MIRLQPPISASPIYQILGRNGFFSPVTARRSFFPPPPPQTITHSAVMPYSPSDLYGIIADISSYPRFLPFCTSASVISWSRPDADQKKWPARASLGIGWGNINEEYISRVYCIPGKVVEAVAGNAQTGLSSKQLRIYEGVEGMGIGGGRKSNTEVDGGGDIFKSLRTRWELQEANQGTGSKVELRIDFDFQNPLYAALSGAAVPKVAVAVVEAFEKRAKEVLGSR